MGSTPQTPGSDQQPLGPLAGQSAGQTPDQVEAAIAANVAQLAASFPSVTVTAESPSVVDNPQTTDDLSHNVGAQLYHTLTNDLHLQSWAAKIIASFFQGVVSVVVPILSIGLPVLATVGEVFGDLLVKQLANLRAKDNSALHTLIEDVMGEFFGADFSQGAKPFKSGGSVLQRAQHIGDQVYGLLKSEFLAGQSGVLQPSEAGASTFLGFNVDFSIYTAVLDLIAELSSFDHADEIRELGANIARNLGLGRMARQVMMPLIKIAVQDPQTWALNKQFRPAVLPEPQIVQMLEGGFISAADAQEALARLGYTEDMMNQLLQVHQKRFGPTEVERLIRWGVWTFDQGAAYLAAQGYPLDLAKVYIQAVQLARMDNIENQLLQRVRTLFVDGFIDADTFNQHLSNLHLAPGELGLIQGVVQAEIAIPHRALSFAQLTTAFEDKLIDISEVEDELAREGHSPDDVAILRSLLLIKSGDAAAAAQAKAEAAAAKAAKAAAKGTPTPPTPPAPPAP